MLPRLLPVLLLAACALAGAALPADAVILPESAVRLMLGQCSRMVPDAGESSWQPGEVEIAALEAALPAALRAEPPSYDRGYLDNAPQGWRRQYVGIVRGGRRFVYGNFFPRTTVDDYSDRSQWHREPVVVCDGGPVFFGVEYDVESRRFTQIAYNGSA